MTRFAKALPIILKHEGGYVNDPQDPGGETNYGITVAVARAHGYNGPMRSIPMAFVQKVYRVSYWDACRCDELPAGIDLMVFDAAVNHGAGRSRRMLQEALNVTVDGAIGPITLGAARNANRDALATELAARRMVFYARLPHLPRFGLGWSRRLMGVLAEAIRTPV